MSINDTASDALVASGKRSREDDPALDCTNGIAHIAGFTGDSTITRA